MSESMKLGISYYGRTYEEGKKNQLARWVQGDLVYFEIQSYFSQIAEYQLWLSKIRYYYCYCPESLCFSWSLFFAVSTLMVVPIILTITGLPVMHGNIPHCFSIFGGKPVYTVFSFSILATWNSVCEVV